MNSNVNCPACKKQRLHTQKEWDKFHPLKGHGFTKEQGWSCKEAQIANQLDKTKDGK